MNVVAALAAEYAALPAPPRLPANSTRDARTSVATAYLAQCRGPIAEPLKIGSAAYDREYAAGAAAARELLEKQA